ncbi:KICSTOR complex protein SZT2-like [Centruroides sculpturatus]|uniref:KICSTOR complex protein SZT2-like n=1 Tax=Centruroides sculpturatus TaxID=218467 RepID=UPI000C6E7F08|nr:KICSTOR complex protein SZT2-like [Centruroides sculpturatus]
MILEADHVYVIMKKDYRISRNIRAQWYFDHLNKSVKVKPKKSLSECTGEIDVVSIIPKHSPENWNINENHNYNFMITSSSVVTFFARKYRLVYCVDLSASVATVDKICGNILFDEIFLTVEKSLRGIVKPFYIPGSSFIFQPELYLTVFAHVPFCTSKIQQVIVQGWIVTSSNVNEILESIHKKLLRIGANVAEITANINRQNELEESDTEHMPDGIFDEHYSSYQKKSLNIPSDINAVNMLRYGILSIQLLPENSSAGIIIITDGTLSFPNTTMLDSLLTQLHNSTISCSFLQLGSRYHPFACFGFVPYADLMQFIATATCGAYLSNCPDVDDSYKMNIYHKAFYSWSFQNHSFKTNHELLDNNFNNDWILQNKNFYNSDVQSYIKKKQMEGTLPTSLSSILSCRLREGYVIKSININKRENQIEVKLLLPWKFNVNIEYSVVSHWLPVKGSESSQNFTSPTCTYEVVFEGSYELLHDVTCPMKKAIQSSYRNAVVKQFRTTLKNLSRTDQLLAHIHSFSHNSVYYTVPESIKNGIPVFDLLPNSDTNISLNESSQNFTSPTCTYEVVFEGSYELLHDVTCPMKKAIQSSYRNAVVKQFRTTLKNLSRTDQLLAHIHSFSHNSVYYTVPESIKNGIPVFDLLPNSDTNISLKNSSHAQFANFWKPICLLDINIWQKWMHTHRIGIILEHDMPLPKNIHLPNSNGRYNQIQCRQALTLLNKFLREYSSFVLIESNSYIKLLFRIQIVTELREKILSLKFPKRTITKDFQHYSFQKNGGSPQMHHMCFNQEWKEINCCILLRKPVEKMLIRYLKMPSDFTRSISSQMNTQFTNQRFPSFNNHSDQVAVDMLVTLSRYLYHQRWIWTLQNDLSYSISMNVVAQLLSTIIQMRLQEGFHFAHSNSGIINMVHEIDMKINTSIDGSIICRITSPVKKGSGFQEPKRYGIELTDLESGLIELLIGADVAGKLMTSRYWKLACGLAAIETQLGGMVMGHTAETLPNNTALIVIFILYKDIYILDLWTLDSFGITDPSEKKTKFEIHVAAEQSQDEDIEIELPEADGELQIITECWVEPQNGIAIPNSPGVNHLNGLTYEQFPQSMFPIDLDCVSCFLTIEHLSLLCKNRNMSSPFALDADNTSSATPLTTDMHQSFLSAARSTPDILMSQTLLISPSYETNIQIIPFSYDIMKILSKCQQMELLFSTFIQGLANSSMKQVNDQLPNQYLFEFFMDCIIEINDREINLSSSDMAIFPWLVHKRERNWNEYSIPFHCPNIPSELHIDSNYKFPGERNKVKLDSVPKWRCFVKNVETSHVLLTFIPATFEDLKNLVFDKSSSYDFPPKSVKIVSSLNWKETEIIDMVIKSKDKSNNIEEELNISKSNEEDMFVNSTGNYSSHSEMFGSITLPIYVYNCSLNSLVNQLVYHNKDKHWKDLYHDITFKIDDEHLGYDNSGTFRNDTYNNGCTKQSTPEPRSEESEVESDKEPLRTYCNMLEIYFQKSFAYALFKSLHHGSYIDKQDVLAVIDGICKESLIEINITKFLQMICGHMKDFCMKATVEQKRHSSEKINNKNKCKNENDAKTENLTSENSESNEKLFPLEVLQRHQPCEPLQQLHSDIKNKFLQILQHSFKPIPSLPDFYYFCPPCFLDNEVFPVVNENQEKILEDRESTVAHTDINEVSSEVGLISEDIEETESMHATKIDIEIYECVMDHQDIERLSNVSNHTQGTQSALSSLLDEEEHFNSTQETSSQLPPLFIHMTCSVRRRKDVGSCSVSSLPTCLETESMHATKIDIEIYECVMDHQDIERLSNVSNHTQGTQSALSSLLDEEEHFNSTQETSSQLPPLFIHMTCSVRRRKDVGSCSVSSLPTCLGEVIKCLKLSSLEINLKDLEITLDILCLSLPPEVEYPQLQFISPLYEQDTENIRNECKNWQLLPKDVMVDSMNYHDFLSSEIKCGNKIQYKILQHKKQMIEWMLQDEIASAALNTYPLTVTTLEMVAKHVKNSTQYPCCLMEEVPLQFVFGSDISLDKFTQEFKQMSAPGYHLKKEENYYYLIIDIETAEKLKRPFGSLIPPLGAASKDLIIQANPHGDDSTQLKNITETSYKDKDIHVRRLSDTSLTEDCNQYLDFMKTSNQSINAPQILNILRQKTHNEYESETEDGEDKNYKKSRMTRKLSSKSQRDRSREESRASSVPPSLPDENLSLSHNETLQVGQSAPSGFTNFFQNVDTLLEWKQIKEESNESFYQKYMIETERKSKNNYFESSEEIQENNCHSLSDNRSSSPGIEVDSQNISLSETVDDVISRDCTEIENDETTGLDYTSKDELPSPSDLADNGFNPRLHLTTEESLGSTPVVYSEVDFASCIGSGHVSNTEEGYEGDSSESDSNESDGDCDWLNLLDTKRPLLPGFWLIMEIFKDKVCLYFHIRHRDEEDEELKQSKEILSQVIHIIRNICKVVNQSLLLQNLHESRMCNQLLVPEANEDIWKPESSTVEQFKSLKRIPSFDDYNQNNYLEATLKFMPGAFDCDVIWQTHFTLHHRLYTGQSRSNMSRGIQALRTVLNTFSVNNRNNMFVYQERSGSVFYLRLHEVQCLQAEYHKGEDVISLGVSVKIVFYYLRECFLQEFRPRLSSGLSEKDQFHDSASYISNKISTPKPRHCIALHVHGISEVGLDIKEDLVKALQSKLDDAVLDVITMMLKRNSMCKLTPEDVHFIQKVGKEPTHVTHYTLHAQAFPHLHAIGVYLRQNLLHFLHTPKYKDNKPEHHFRPYPDDLSQTSFSDDDVFLHFLYQSSGVSGNKELACVIVSVVDGQGRPVQHISCPMLPSSTAYKDGIAPYEYEEFTFTTPYEPNPECRSPGPIALIRFQIWCASKVDVNSLCNKLGKAVRHALWDLLMEYRLITAPISDFIQNDESHCNSEPNTPLKTRRTGWVMTEHFSKEHCFSPINIPSKGTDFSTSISNGANNSPVQSPHESVFKFADPQAQRSLQTNRTESSSSPLPLKTNEMTSPSNLLNIYETGEKGKLQTTYQKTIKSFLKFGKKLEVPTVKTHVYYLKNCYPVSIILKEFQAKINELTPDIYPRIFQKVTADSEEFIVINNAWNMHLPTDSKGLIINENSLPGKTKSYIMIGRNVNQWKACMGCSEFFSYLESVSKNQMNYQKYPPHLINFQANYKAHESTPTSPITFSRSSSIMKISTPLSAPHGNCSSNISRGSSPCTATDLSTLQFIPRQRLLLLYITKTKGIQLSTQNYATTSINYIDALIRNHNFPQKSNQMSSLTNLKRSSTMLAVNRNSSLDIFRETHPPQPLHRTRYGLLRDLVMRHGKQMLDIYNTESRDLQDVHRIWQSRSSALTSPLMERFLHLFKKVGRLEHYCLTPILFSPSWRWKVSPIRDHTLQPLTSQIFEKSFNQEGITSNRSRHSSGNSVKNNENTNSSGSSIRSRKSSGSSHQLLNNLGRSSSRLITEEAWHFTVCSHYIQEYIQYLQTLGFLPIQTRGPTPRQSKSLKSKDDEKLHGKGTHISAFSHPRTSNCGLSVYYLIRSMLGGLLVFEVGFSDPYAFCHLYSLECLRLKSNNSRFMSSQFTTAFVDELDRIKIVMHLHSFTFDYHLRTIYSYISGQHLIFHNGYHLTSFLDDFMKYYQKSPSCARNVIHSDTLAIKDTNLPPCQLYNYIISHNKSYSMTVHKMVPIIHSLGVEMDTEFVLVDTVRTCKVSYSDANDVCQVESFDVGLLITHDISVVDDIPESNTLFLKYYIILTSQREPYPKLFNSPRNLGTFKPIRLAVSHPSGSQSRKCSTASNPSEEKTKLEDSGEFSDASENTKSRVSSPRGMCDEEVMYLGYFSSQETLMQQFLYKHIKASKMQLEDIVKKAALHCRRDFLWNNLLPYGNKDDSSNKEKNVTSEFAEFSELLSLVTVVPLDDIDNNLAAFLNMHITWYQGLSKVLKNKYLNRHRYFRAPDENMYYVAVMHSKYQDFFMLLHVNLHSSRANLCLVLREKQEDQDKSTKNLESMHCLIEEFVNVCCFHLWSGIV